MTRKYLSQSTFSSGNNPKSARNHKNKQFIFLNQEKQQNLLSFRLELKGFNWFNALNGNYINLLIEKYETQYCYFS